MEGGERSPYSNLEGQMVTVVFNVHDTTFPDRLASGSYCELVD
jgi:hypothetical protein